MNKSTFREIAIKTSEIVSKYYIFVSLDYSIFLVHQYAKTPFYFVKCITFLGIYFCFVLYS